MVKSIEITASETKECTVVATISRDKDGWCEHNTPVIITPYGDFEMARDKDDVWEFIESIYKNRTLYEEITTMDCKYVRKNYVHIHAMVEYESANHDCRSVSIYASKDRVLRSLKNNPFAETVIRKQL